MFKSQFSFWYTSVSPLLHKDVSKFRNYEGGKAEDKLYVGHEKE